MSLTRALCCACAVAAIGAHGIHFGSYAAPPELVKSSAVVIRDVPAVPALTSPEAPRRFDSEGPLREAENRVSNASPAATGGNVVRAAGSAVATGSATAYATTVRVDQPEAPRRFDSEGPLREVENRGGSAGSATGGGGVNIRPETVMATATIPTPTVKVDQPDPAARFDSESPQRVGERRPNSDGAGVGSGGVTTVDIGQAVETDTAPPLKVRSSSRQARSMRTPAARTEDSERRSLGQENGVQTG